MMRPLFGMVQGLCLIIIFLSLTGCVTPMPLQDQAPSFTYKDEDGILITVIDERIRVKEGKPPNFVGIAHATFGIPVDWHVYQVLATEEGDKERNLSEWLEYRIVTGLSQEGCPCAAVHFDEFPDAGEASKVLEENDAAWLFALVLNEWYFSVNLNWVTAFNFDTDTDFHCFHVNNGHVFKKRFKERDVIDERADESYQNLIMEAYKAQLQQIFNDEEIRLIVKP